MGAGNWVHVDVNEILRATDAALLCQIGDVEVWLPRSQISEGEQYEAGDTDVTLSVSEWIAREKGLGE